MQSHPPRLFVKAMKLLAFAGSIRTGSYNRLLVSAAASIAREAGAEVDLADFTEFRMSGYDPQEEAATGLPAGALALKARIDAADGLIVSTPEYNNSVPGTVKNAIDWVSRARPNPWSGKHGLVLSASPGMAGGRSAAWMLRVPLEVCGMILYPEMLSLGQADQAFDDKGALKNLGMQGRLEKLVHGYVAMATALATRK